MIKEAIGVGATLEEATEKAKAELNASFDEEVQYDVLAYPKKKVLGVFGGSPAKVRVFIEMPDPIEPEKKKKPERKKPDIPKDKREQPRKPARPAAADRAEKPERPRPEKIEKTENYAPAVDESEIDKNSPAGRAIAYIRTVLEKLNVGEIKISAAVAEKSARIALEGEDLGIIIGRRGETLDALQYLSSLAANSGDGFFRISLDTGDYREKREQTLKSLARRVSAQVLKSGRSRALEPMNPYERRIIHTEIQLIEGVESNSTGEGVNRRVIISPEGAFRRDRAPRPRGGDRRRPPQSAKAPAPKTDREPKRDSDLPLYGKID